VNERSFERELSKKYAKAPAARCDMNEGESQDVSTSETGLAVAGADGLKKVIPWGALAIAAIPMMGMLGYLLRMMGERIMCTKNGCKGHGTLVKSVSLILCSTHEGALDRVPVIRTLMKEKYLADVRTSAFAHGGNAELASSSASKALDIEDKLLDVSLEWSKVSDVVTETPIEKQVEDRGWGSNKGEETRP